MTTANDTFSPAQYQTQLNTKIDKYQQTLADFEVSDVAVFPLSPSVSVCAPSFASGMKTVVLTTP